MLTHGSLFSGIGGFDLGFERAGIKTLWQVENDPYAVKVLERHWPNVKRYGDIKAIEWEAVEVPDIVSGGFPCQPVSVAGKRRGADDERWLWPEFARCLRVLRPRYVVLENVPGLLALGFGDVLGDLAALGYDAEWDCIPAVAFGAPHLRYRVWVVAYAASDLRRTSGDSRSTTFNGGGATVGDAGGSGRNGVDGRRSRAELTNGCTDVPNARSGGRGAVERDVLPGEPDAIRGGADVADAASTGLEGPKPARLVFGERRGLLTECDWWTVEPDVGRVAYGIPARVDRLKCLGNAIVPQIAEWLGRRITEFDLAR